VTRPHHQHQHPQHLQEQQGAGGGGGGRGAFAIFQEDSGSDDSQDDDDEETLWHAKERLLQNAKDGFSLPYSSERGYRATELQFCSTSRPHMRAMHASWICFFASYFVQFSMAPLLPQLQRSLNLSKRDIWWTNVWMMVGGIPMRFLLGPLCDTYGPRVVMVWMVALCAIPCALSGLLVVNLSTLLMVRFVMGAMDAFVPCQCWITSHFVREVGGTIMAIAGGLGASGSAFTQIIVGFLFVLCTEWTGGNQDLAWRLTLLFPAAVAGIIATLSYYYTDDGPLGNFVTVQKAGLMMQRSSAVDSFRSGATNVNAWLLSLQFAGSCGVDVTMCNGCAIYFHDRFHQPIAAAGAIAFLYGISAIYARGVGGYVSDRLGDHFSLKGRLWGQLGCMIVQGCLTIWFARTASLYPSMILMVLMSILIQVRFSRNQSSVAHEKQKPIRSDLTLRVSPYLQSVCVYMTIIFYILSKMSMGTCFGLVAYVDSVNTGSVAGIVGAGGNIGGVILGLLFMSHDYELAMEYMGWFTIGMALVTPLIVVKGYKGILFGKEDVDDDSRKQHSPLMVPKRRMQQQQQHSPSHLVTTSLRRKKMMRPQHH
jgi:NNP family nitrate/nitrite transporter-like MFS transporter